MSAPVRLAPPLIALGSAACYALALVVAQLGLRQRPVVAAASVSLPTATLLLWLGAPMLLDVNRFDAIGLLTYAGIGLVFPVVVTLLSFESNRRLGANLAGTLGNTTPVFALFCAVLVLGERLTALRLLGTAVVVSGVLLLTLRRAGAARAHSAVALALPLAAAAIRGFVQALVKFGLAHWPDPFAASLVSYSVSCCVILALAARAPPVARPHWQERLLFGIVGAGNALSVLLMYVALAHGSVLLVAPLIGTYPLFTLAFAVVLLGERVTEKRLIAGAVLTMLGVALVLVG